MHHYFKEMGYDNRLHAAYDQIRQIKANEQYPTHYIANAVSILLDCPELFVDYNRVSHDNEFMIHGFKHLIGVKIMPEILKESKLEHNINDWFYAMVN